MANTNKKYQYYTKAIPLPDGRRKYVRAKSQDELERKVEELQSLLAVGVKEALNKSPRTS